MWAALGPLLAPFITKLIGLIPDPNAKAAAEAEWTALAIKLLQESDDRQAKVNEAEANSDSLFVSGWRPAAGWVAVLGFFMQTVGYPLLAWALSIWSPGTRLPDIDTELMVTLLFGMLGLGGYRTFEKLRKR